MLFDLNILRRLIRLIYRGTRVTVWFRGLEAGLTLLLTDTTAAGHRGAPSARLRRTCHTRCWLNWWYRSMARSMITVARRRGNDFFALKKGLRFANRPMVTTMQRP